MTDAARLAVGTLVVADLQVPGRLHGVPESRLPSRRRDGRSRHHDRLASRVDAPDNAPGTSRFSPVSMYDAIVIGARRAGATTAMLVARKGYRPVQVATRGRLPAFAPRSGATRGSPIDSFWLAKL